MPYKREIAKKSKRVISENLRHYLLTGKMAKADVAVFQIMGNLHKIRAIWHAVTKDILTEWIKKNPCTRPFTFWLLAPEKRKKVSGSGGWQPGMAVDTDGLPQYWQLHWDKKNPPVFESQAAFLQRNGLLTTVETAFLKKYPELLEPERVEFDE